MGCCGILLKVIGAIAILLAVGVGWLQSDCACRACFFAKFFRLRPVKSDAFLREVVCPHIAGVEGVVVDVGSGTGITLVCYANMTKITKIYLVEPNPHFEGDLLANAAKFGLTDKVEIIVEGGQAMNNRIPDGSVDHAVSVHLICSIDSGVLASVAGSVAQVLRPGGQWHMVDHTAAPEGTWTRAFQRFVAPVWEIVGNGCKFLPMPVVYRDLFNGKANALVATEVVEFQATALPRIASIIHPHVKGRAAKPNQGK